MIEQLHGRLLLVMQSEVNVLPVGLYNSLLVSYQSHNFLMSIKIVQNFPHVGKYVKTIQTTHFLVKLQFI